MNHKCHGDFYILRGERFYRCFANGVSYLANRLSDGAACRECKRTVSASSDSKTEIDSRASTDIYLVEFGWVPHIVQGARPEERE